MSDINTSILSNWLQARPEAAQRRDAVLLGLRHGCRVFPEQVRYFSPSRGFGVTEESVSIALQIARALLTSFLVTRFEASELKVKSLNAARAINEIDGRWVAHTAASVASGASDTSFVLIGITFARGPGTLEALEADMRLLDEDEKSPWLAPLWLDGAPDRFTIADSGAREIWSRDPETWDFWLRWWDGVLSGNQLDWELQKAVALEIPEEAWSNPKTVAAHIREIEARFRQPKEDDWLEASIANQPQPAKAQVKTTQAAMERNREALPPTFEAIEGLLLLEIERLQLLNYVDEAIVRQLGIYLQLYEAVRALRAQLPEQGPVSEKAAEKSIGLLSLYIAKLSELPRAKVDDVVEGVYETGKGVVKLGLIGLSTALGVSYGLPALGCLAVGSMVFAPKSAAELIKGAKEVLAATPKP